MVNRDPWVLGNRWDVWDGITPGTLPRVSVVVAHFDQPTQLARTLHALALQDYPSELLEIVVADDGSPGEISVPDGVVLVRQEDRGFRLAAARNLGVRSSTGDVLCFLDADTTPEPGYVRALTRLPALVPDALTVGRRRHAALADVPPEVPVVDAARGRELAEPSWLADAYDRTRDLLDADDRSYRFVVGAVMACSRRLFDEVGGFDETFTSYGGEDWEWAHRMWQAGAVLAHVPEAVAWHDGPEWSDRADSRGERANEQTVRLMTSIPVPGSAPRGLMPAAPDIALHLRGTHPPAALLIAIDSFLEVFPRARVVLDADAGPLIEDPRVVVGGGVPGARVVWHLDRPAVILDEKWITGAVAELGCGEVGTIDVRAADGTALGTLRSRRAERRAARWGTEASFRTVRALGAGIHPVRDVPDLEAWVGRWGGPARFS